MRARLRVVALLVLLLAVLAVRAFSQSRPPGGSQAASSDSLRIVISTAKRRLWVVTADGDTLLSTAVAVGSGRTLRGANRSWYFHTPLGTRRIVSTEVDPVWVRPDWAYVEVAKKLSLRIDTLGARQSRLLPGGDVLTMRNGIVGVISDATFEPLPADEEVVFGDVLYVPPIGSAQRNVHGVLGKYRLNLGDGIGIHGTNDSASIGHAVTHGCIRVADVPLEWLYLHVPVGTRVFIY